MKKMKSSVTGPNLGFLKYTKSRQISVEIGMIGLVAWLIINDLRAEQQITVIFIVKNKISEYFWIYIQRRIKNLKELKNLKFNIPSPNQDQIQNNPFFR